LFGQHPFDIFHSFLSNVRKFSLCAQALFFVEEESFFPVSVIRIRPGLVLVRKRKRFSRSFTESWEKACLLAPSLLGAPDENSEVEVFGAF
jgi:hypothetical protein